MNMKKNINEEIERIKDVMGLTENVAVNSLDDFPEDLKNIFFNNYGHLINKYDWNTENDKFTNRETGEYDGVGFGKWKEEEQKRQFEKNKRRIMSAVTEDLVGLRRQKYFRKKLKEYEDELLDLFGFHITYEGGINDSVFHDFVVERPKYKKYYDKWHEFFEFEMNKLFKNYNSAVNVPSYADIRKIYNFLKTGKTT
jgi:hypothetical protein